MMPFRAVLEGRDDRRYQIAHGSQHTLRLTPPRSHTVRI
jgi:hypothetical protein